MITKSFSEKLTAAAASNNSLVCIGLDPLPERLPESVQASDLPVFEFNRQIIDATADLVCAYKPNFAFYGALGVAGWQALKATIEHIPRDIPVIVDAKVGDIGSTSERYAAMVFDELQADAVTVNAYMGADAVAPFLSYESKGTFLLCLTSNPGADDLERCALSDGQRVYERVAAKAVAWNSAGNCGLVVGATQSDSMRAIREIAPELPFLVPGVGAQGGDVEQTVRAATRADGYGVLISTSRSVLYASADDFATAAREAAAALRDRINQFRQQPAAALSR